MGKPRPPRRLPVVVPVDIAATPVALLVGPDVRRRDAAIAYGQEDVVPVVAVDQPVTVPPSGGRHVLFVVLRLLPSRHVLVVVLYLLGGRHLLLIVLPVLVGQDLLAVGLVDGLLPAIVPVERARGVVATEAVLRDLDPTVVQDLEDTAHSFPPFELRLRARTVPTRAILLAWHEGEIVVGTCLAF